MLRELASTNLELSSEKGRDITLVVAAGRAVCETHLLTFLLAALLLELTPGPNMAYLATLALARGRAAGLIATAGVALGLAVQALTAGTGARRRGRRSHRRAVIAHQARDALKEPAQVGVERLRESVKCRGCRVANWSARAVDSASGCSLASGG